MTNDELRAIEARANAATAGPWKFIEPIPEVAGIVGFVQNGPEPWQTLGDNGEPGKMSHGDAMFIAHARTDVPALVEEVRRLRELVREAYLEAMRTGTGNSAEWWWESSDARKALEGA